MIKAATAKVAPLPDDVTLKAGPYLARVGTSPDVVAQALALREDVFAAFRESDQDAFDELSLHGIVFDSVRQTVCVAFRARVFPDGLGDHATYTGLTYDLSPLSTIRAPILELGRICQNNEFRDPIALRLAWAAIYQLVQQNQVALVFGCTSLPTADPMQHAPLLGELNARHLGPAHLMPKRASPLAVSLPSASMHKPVMPPLLRAYLRMGGWVGDHAVVDPELDTVHIFTGLCPGDIPQKRKDSMTRLIRWAQAYS